MENVLGDLWANSYDNAVQSLTTNKKYHIPYLPDTCGECGYPLADRTLESANKKFLAGETKLELKCGRCKKAAYKIEIKFKPEIFIVEEN